MNMYGILILIKDDGKGIVDTRNNQYKTLDIYNLPKGIQVNTTVEFEVILSKWKNYYAKFIKIADKNINKFNTEDREKWYKWGEDGEREFIKKIVPTLKNNIIINPEKNMDSSCIDLYDLTNNKYADLKIQDTPFFTSRKYKYGGIPYDPSYTVSFNKKDYENYKKKYPSCDIYFWVNWKQLSYKGITVNPVKGVWRASFFKMVELIENNTVTLHCYKHRESDDHNAKDSYLFNLNDSEVFERLI